MPDLEANPVSVVDGGDKAAPAAPAAPAQPEAKPSDQETVDLTSIGYNKTLPKAILEKIASFDPETLDYLGKADLKDRATYETSFENWNKGQAQKLSAAEQSRVAYEKKQKEADAIIREHSHKLKELDRVWGERAWESELPDASKASLANMKQLLADGTIAQDTYDAMVKPIIDGVKSSMLAREAENDRKVKAVRDEITAHADAIAPKYGFTGEIVAHCIEGLCAKMDINPAKAREVFEAEVERVVNLRLVQKPKPEPVSPDSKTPPPIPAKIDSPDGRPSKEAKASFMAGLFRPRESG